LCQIPRRAIFWRIGRDTKKLAPGSNGVDCAPQFFSDNSISIQPKLPLLIYRGFFGAGSALRETGFFATNPYKNIRFSIQTSAPRYINLPLSGSLL